MKMVLKHGKLGVRSGNTVRCNCLKNKKSMGFIKKQLLNTNTQTVLNHGKYFDDGDLKSTRYRELWYSLNKQKRWMLVDTLKSVIDDEDLAKEEYRVVLYERVVHDFTIGDCIGYHDSKLSDQDVNCKHRHSRNKTFSYLTDLRLADQDRISNTKKKFEKSVAKKKKFHNQHFRGLQRNHLANHKNAEHENRHWGWFRHRRGVIRGNPEDTEPNIPELRYEVCYPPDPVAKSLMHSSTKNLKWRSYEAQRYYPGTRAAMFGHHCHGNRKSFTKVKGKRDKPWAKEYYRGACIKTIKECIEQRHELSWNYVQQDENKYVSHYGMGLCDETYSSVDFTDFDEDVDKSNDVEDYIWELNKIEDYYIDLIDLIKPKVSRQRRKFDQKTRRNMDGLHPNVAMETHSPFHGKDIKVHPNIAMGTYSQFYGKEKLIYSERPENSTFLMEESSDEEDFLSQSDVSTFNGGGGQELSSDSQVLSNASDDQVLEETYLSCHISSDSIKSALQNGLCNKTIRFSQCKPARYAVQLSGETPLSDSHVQCYLLLWERCSADSSYKEYSIRVQDSRLNSTDIHGLLETSIDSRSSRVYTLNELIWMSENVINQLISTTKINSFSKMKIHWSEFITLENDLDLTLRLSGSQVDVKSIQEIHYELAEERGDKSSEDTITSFDVISVEELNFGVEEIPDYCNICVIPFTDDVTMEMTSLLPCQHIFCNQCWISYITERIRQGDDIIPCLGYSCEEVLDDVTIMSFVSSKMYKNWKRRKQESLVEKSGKWKWCPNNSCKYLARTNTCTTDNIVSSSSSVQCKCDSKWCLHCQQPDHWPASCEQITVYRKMLEQNGDESGKKIAPTKTYFAHVKKCPNCNHPMEKDGGCSHMTCRCKHHFCWECLADWNDHAINGLHCTSGVKKEITMELDSEIFHPLPLKFYKRSVYHRYKWKSLGRGHIRRKVYHHESKRKAHHYKTKRRAKLDVPNYFTPNKQLIQYYIFIKQTHQILEKILIVMSNLTRKSRRRHIEHLMLQAEFCVDRQEQILEKNKLSEEDIEKVNRLHTSTWDCLQKIALYMPMLQATIFKSKQKILGKPLSSFEMFK